MGMNENAMWYRTDSTSFPRAQDGNAVWCNEMGRQHCNTDVTFHSHKHDIRTRCQCCQLQPSGGLQSLPGYPLTAWSLLLFRTWLSINLPPANHPHRPESHVWTHSQLTKCKVHSSGNHSQQSWKLVYVAIYFVRFWSRRLAGRDRVASRVSN